MLATSKVQNQVKVIFHQLTSSEVTVSMKAETASAASFLVRFAFAAIAAIKSILVIIKKLFFIK
jgi:hypothetical protein